jgi:hypothetical protein
MGQLWCAELSAVRTIRVLTKLKVVQSWCEWRLDLVHSCAGAVTGAASPGGPTGYHGGLSGPSSPFPHLRLQETPVKTHDIEIQRLKSVRHDNGLVEIKADLAVQNRPVRDELNPSSNLRLTVDNARTLLLLLKQQIADLDKLQPRSRRSGRA